MKSRMMPAVICVTVVLAAAVCGGRMQSQESSAQTRWEYTIVSHTRLAGLTSLDDALGKARTLQELEALNNDVAHRMTDLGKQGWELVCLQGDRSFVFKRKVS